MKKSFSVIDKQFFRRIVWLFILALFSVLIFWQQTRAAEGAPVALGKGWGGLVDKAGIERVVPGALRPPYVFAPPLSHPLN